jgi:hypothetical protein
MENFLLSEFPSPRLSAAIEKRFAEDKASLDHLSDHFRTEVEVYTEFAIDRHAHFDLTHPVDKQLWDWCIERAIFDGWWDGNDPYGCRPCWLDMFDPPDGPDAGDRHD